MIAPAYELLCGATRAQVRTHTTDGASASMTVSRSYAGSYALVGWHTARLGVDLEAVGDHGRGFAESICTAAELAALGPRLHEPELITALWSGKEALAKALGDATDYDPRRLDSPLIWTASARWRAQQISAPAGYVGWVCWEAAGPPGFS